MASINLILKSTKNPASLYVRFTNTRAIDIVVLTGISINPNFWDSKNQKIRNVIEVPSRDEINSKLSKLKIHILDDFNIDYMNGEIIDKQWLEGSIAKFANRPKGEVKRVNLDHQIYYTDFAKWWIDNEAPTWQVSSNGYMNQKTKYQYLELINVVKEFEGKKKIKLLDIDAKLMKEFSNYLTELKYSEITAKRIVSRFKFFCSRAEENNLGINKNYRQRVFVAKQTEEYKQPYLDLKEIERIYNKDLSNDNTLDNVRDNFIIGLFTGLRVSDFLTSLDVSNINDGFIQIKTKKTKTNVSLPVHKYIKAILKKRGGFLPPKISEQKFNEHIKTICQICDIDEYMVGGVTFVDEETKVIRKKIGVYQKWELVTSHICRRSFATNLFGQLPNSDIMKLGGWSSEKMMLHYIQLTDMDSAITLQKYWEEQN